MPKKKTEKKPKPRFVWAINPKSRITPSRKRYSRKKEEKNWVDELFD